MKLHLAIFNVVWCVLPSYMAYGEQDMFLLLSWKLGCCGCNFMWMKQVMKHHWTWGSCFAFYGAI